MPFIMTNDNRPVNRPDTAINELLSILPLLFATVARAEAGWALRANSYLGVLYATFMSLIEPSRHAETPIDALSQPQLVSRIDELLQAHLAAPLTQAQLADEASMSPRHLSRRFNAYTGMTIHARLEVLRMEQAAKLLRHTHLPIAEVARAIGITHAAYFAERFRRYFEMTPHQFRARRSTPVTSSAGESNG